MSQNRSSAASFGGGKNHLSGKRLNSFGEDFELQFIDEGGETEEEESFIRPTSNNLPVSSGDLRSILELFVRAAMYTSLSIRSIIKILSTVRRKFLDSKEFWFLAITNRVDL